MPFGKCLAVKILMHVSLPRSSTCLEACCLGNWIFPFSVKVIGLVLTSSHIFTNTHCYFIACRWGTHGFDSPMCSQSAVFPSQNGNIKKRLFFFIAVVEEGTLQIKVDRIAGSYRQRITREHNTNRATWSLCDFVCSQEVQPKTGDHVRVLQTTLSVIALENCHWLLALYWFFF